MSHACSKSASSHGLDEMSRRLATLREGKIDHTIFFEEMFILRVRFPIRYIAVRSSSESRHSSVSMHKGHVLCNMHNFIHVLNDVQLIHPCHLVLLFVQLFCAA